MRRFLFFAFCSLLVLAGGAAGGAYYWDAQRTDLLAEGITVAGVQIGGMRADEARAVVERRVVEPLQRPVAVGYAGGQFVLDPAEADVETNIAELLRAALAESRDGNFLTRTLRDVRGRALGSELPLEVRFSEDAVRRFARRLARKIDRSPREAKSSVSLAGVRISPSADGIAVRAKLLERRLANQLRNPESSRRMKLPTRPVRPDVTTEELRRKFRYFITVSRGGKELRFFVNQKLAKTYRVAIGRVGFATPAGLYSIVNKAVNPAWYVPNKPWAGDLAGKVIPPDDPQNPIKARWLGFYDGAGIHGTADTASIGTAASHGCVRMTIPDVVELYDRVPVNTPLYIA